MGFDALYGLELTDCSDSLVRGRVRVRESSRSPRGSSTAASTARSPRRWPLAAPRPRSAPRASCAVGLSHQTTSLHPIAGGTIHATAVRRHRGRTTWVWEVEIADDEQRRCAVARVTIAVRDP